MWYVKHSSVPLLISQSAETQTWGGGSDSYFEYLIKYARLTNTDDPLWAREWATAVDTSIKVLSSVRSVFGHLDRQVLMVYRGPESVTGCTWRIGIKEGPKGSSAHTWLASTPETSSS